MHTWTRLLDAKISQAHYVFVLLAIAYHTIGISALIITQGRSFPSGKCIPSDADNALNIVAAFVTSSCSPRTLAFSTPHRNRPCKTDHSNLTREYAIERYAMLLASSCNTFQFIYICNTYKYSYRSNKQLVPCKSNEIIRFNEPIPSILLPPIASFISILFLLAYSIL